MGFIKDFFEKIKDGDPEAPEFDDGEEGTDGAGDAAVENSSGIKSFEYSYNGSIGGNNYSYKVKTEDGKCVLTYYSMVHHDYGDMVMEIPSDFYAKLNELYLSHRLKRWDGFHKSNRFVLDGDGFSLYMTFMDKKSLSASGTNSFPRGYGDFKSDMDELFEPFTTELLEKCRQAKIEQGVTGEVDHVMANFIQHGASGSDRYEMLLYEPGIREMNVQLQYKSVSGEVFPKGEKNIYAAMPDVDKYFKKVGDICRKYDIIKWYDYDVAAEDYNNCEWFQINIGFEEGHISALGTEHPEGYDGFREEMIKIMKEISDEIPKEKE